MSFSSTVQSFLKSLSGGETQGEPEKKEGGDIDPNTDPNKDKDKDKEGVTEENMEKGDLVDATAVLNGLVSELGEISKSLKTLVDGQNDVGESIVGVAKMVNQIANSPIPPKSAMAKGGLGSEPGGGGAFPMAAQPANAPPTQDEFERAQTILAKSYKEGEISMIKSEMISSDLQKAMRIPGYKMNPEYYNFLVSKMQTK
jgi:hypothetical protein